MFLSPRIPVLVTSNIKKILFVVQFCYVEWGKKCWRKEFTKVTSKSHLLAKNIYLHYKYFVLSYLLLQEDVITFPCLFYFEGLKSQVQGTAMRVAGAEPFIQPR